MRTNGIGIKLTIKFPIDHPDENGVVYSKEAVNKAMLNLRKELPIIFRGNGGSELIIGHTTGDSHIVTMDDKNHTYNITVNGIIYSGGTECIVNDIEGNVVNDFEITAFGFSTVK